MKIADLIKDVPDFPKKGILFKDFTPLLQSPEGFKSLIHQMAEEVPSDCEFLLGIESRGFILAAALAQKLGLGFIPVRKPGKLPRPTESQSYQLEYGEDSLEIHKEDLASGSRVVIVDDVLATGGTAEAVEKLCTRLDTKILKFLFCMEIEFLEGAKKLTAPSVSLLKY